MEIPAFCTLSTLSIDFVVVNTMNMLKKWGQNLVSLSLPKGKSLVSPAVVRVVVGYSKAAPEAGKFLYLPDSMKDSHVIIGIRKGSEYKQRLATNYILRHFSSLR